MGLSDVTAGIAGLLSGDGDREDEPDGEDDDLMGGETADDEFGDLGGWDDEGDELDEFGEEGGTTADLEPRLDELENEVEGISSTMGTVRSENEAISETVDDIEDNIRKLLEIYEMVTRGVNPFVDDAQGAAGMGDSFGLFDGGDSADEEPGDLDPDVADADAESFFDDDWDDDEFVDDEAFDEIGLDEEDDVVPEGSTSEGDGKTFDELKSEYEDGSTEGSDAGAGERDETPSGGEAASAADGDEGRDEDDAEGSTEGTETPANVEDVDPGDGGSISSAEGADVDGLSDGKPYLGAVPDGYGVDLLVIEWLSYLRGCSDTAEALRAIRYYETIGWLGAPAADSLAQFLTGLTDGEAEPAPNGGTRLTVDHHTNSLRYIGRLGGADVQIERLEWTGSPRRGARPEGGEQRGIQR